MWIVLAATPLTTAFTVSQPRSPLMRPHALSSITYSGSPSQPLQGRVSVVMQEKSVAPETTAATASSENPFKLSRLRWDYGLAVIVFCLTRESARSSVGGLVQEGFDFVRQNYKRMLVPVIAHDLLRKWGVYGTFPKIFRVASIDDGLAALNASMTAGFSGLTRLDSEDVHKILVCLILI